MPADASSSLPSALTQLTNADALQATEASDLLGYLATIPDPRSPLPSSRAITAIGRPLVRTNATASP